MRSAMAVLGVAVLLVVCALFSSCSSENKSLKPGLNNPFFAMNTGTDRNNLSLAEQAQMLKDLGYDGIGYMGLDGIDKMLEELEKRDLKLFNTYLHVRIDPDSEHYAPALPETIKRLRGKDVLLWLTLSSRQFKPSDPAGDAHAVRIIREIADMAGKSGLKVAFYPHLNSWVERVDDGVRLAEKVNRKNVGATFNLCHWLRVEGADNMEQLMKSAMPHLFVVTINGADAGDTKNMKWDRLIQTLDRGSFDTYTFLRTLRQLGYDGPIGLQGYGIKGNARENLTRSMQAWRQFQQRMEKEGT